MPMQDNWDESFKRICLFTAYILTPVSLASLFYFNWRVSLSLVLGGLFGVLNFSGVVWGVQNIIALDKGRSKMMFMTLFRLMVLFSLLLILLIFNVINIPAIVVGLSVVFAFILIEGFKRAREIKDV